MRGALARGALAVTTMVALAFLIPLAMLIRQEARDSALAAAQRQAAAVGPVLAVTSDPEVIGAALAADGKGRMAVHMPDGSVIGTARATRGQVQRARERTADAVDVAVGTAVLQPVVLGDQGVAVIEVVVSGDELTAGLLPSWLILLAVATGLVTTSVVVADRLTSRVVRSVHRLADSAQALGAGDLQVRADPEAPYELRDVGLAFNTMAERIEGLLDSERQFAADVSHRLRTPLTALRLAAGRLPAGPGTARVQQSVAAVERELDEVIRSARSGRLEPGEARSDAIAVTADRMAFWASLGAQQGREVTVDLPSGPAPVPVQAADLVTAVDALVGNVFRHTPAGTALRVSVQLPIGGVLLTVDDAGPGIPPDALDAAAAGHEPTRPTAPGSTGLGLDIVRRQAEGVGGQVAVGRSPLGGARVRVELPDWAAWRHRSDPGRRRRRPRDGVRTRLREVLGTLADRAEDLLRRP